jgi:hypothetical protein
VGGGSVLWAETPDDERDEAEAEAHGAVDESFAVRRLRRWLSGMFGGAPERDDEPPKEEPTND